jgi:hypothetical protein
MAREKIPTTSFEVNVPGETPVPLFAYLYDRAGTLVARAPVEKGAVSVPGPADEIRAGRFFIAPDAGETPSIRRLARNGGYEPFIGIRELPGVIEIPPPIIDIWPFCLCVVKGRVVRGDGRPVCDARVHVCEVDRIPWLIAELPELEVLRLRDDLLDVLLNPQPLPPRPWPPEPIPGPDPAPFRAIRRESAFDSVQPRLNPQPEVPSAAVSVVQPILLQRLQSPAVPIVRAALIENFRLILPWLCLWPWWWARFECDEVRVVDTSHDGRFQTIFFHDCSDQPDLYFWVEFDFGSGFETVHRPLIACNTHWDFACGSEVTITVTDPRVPACVPPPAVGCDVNVLSIGRTVSIREIENDAAGPATEGLTQTGEPFGGKLEPRVDFGPALIGKGIEYYRWSYRRLSGPDGATSTVDAGSVPIGAWTPVTRDVVRHYRETSGATTSYPTYLLGPLPTTEAPTPNLFRIPPELTPAGDHQWRVLDEHEDLASAHFETTKLAGTPVNAGDLDLAAGRYELRLELFDSSGNLVNWTDEGITLGITDQNAPFGTGTVTTSPATNYNRVLDGTGKTVGFRMVVRVDNNDSVAVIDPVGGDITPDPACGFHEYASTSDDVTLSFEASHPNGFATYDFDVVRGATTHVPAAETTGVTGAGGNDGFSHMGGSVYSRDVSVGTLIGGCPSAAFAETLRVYAMAQNGYSRLSGYDAFASAGFALTPAHPGHGGGGPHTP